MMIRKNLSEGRVNMNSSTAIYVQSMGKVSLFLSNNKSKSMKTICGVSRFWCLLGTMIEKINISPHEEFCCLANNSLQFLMVPYFQ